MYGILLIGAVDYFGLVVQYFTPIQKLMLKTIYIYIYKYIYNIYNIYIYTYIYIYNIYIYIYILEYVKYTS
jgi:hypothetical protein